MLVITSAAADAIKAIVATSDAIPDEGGLRIAAVPSADGTGTTLALQVAEEPISGDQVVDEGGAHVFLEPAAAQALDAAELDVQVQGDEVSFAIGPQADSGPPAV